MGEQRDREFSREIRRTEAQKEALESWKRWHREISDALGGEFLERKVTLEKAKDLRTALAQAKRERDEARGLLREWLLWSRDHFIRGTAGMEDRTDAHLRDTGD